MSTTVLQNGKLAMFLYYALIGLSLFGALTMGGMDAPQPIFMLVAFLLILVLMVSGQERTLTIVTSILVSTFTGRDTKEYHEEMVKYHMRRKDILEFKATEDETYQDVIDVHVKAAQIHLDKRQARKSAHAPGRRIHHH